MVDGTPKRDVHPESNARATVVAVISAIGMASGQRVNLSIQVNRYDWPLERGRGPTISTWILSKRAVGVEKVERGESVPMHL